MGEGEEEKKERKRVDTRGKEIQIQERKLKFTQKSKRAGEKCDANETTNEEQVARARNADWLGFSFS